MSSTDTHMLRDAFGRFMTGVTVVTARDAHGNPVGFTANSFTSVSLTPPLLLVCPGRLLSTYETFASCQHFCVSVLGEGQENVANVFAGSKGDRFAKVRHFLDPNGIPLIDHAIAHFSCRTDKLVPAGDHCILIGEVSGFDQRAGSGLGYAGGKFFSLGRERKERDPAAKTNIAGVLLQTRGGVLLEGAPDAYRPPTCAVSDQAALRGTLLTELGRLGVTASLGAVFSVFDDQASGTHHAYILGEVEALTADNTLTAIPVSNLPDLTYASPAVASMMKRFAHESATQNFSLYLGDAVSGEIHTLKDEA